MDDFPSNSVNRDKAPPEREKRVKQVVKTTGRQRKKSAGRKVAETFTADDTGSVANYILMDVLIPAAKNMVSDAVSQGIERLLFGDSIPRSSSSGGTRRGNYTAYNKPSGGSAVRGYAQTTGRRDRNERLQGFQDVILESRGEANEVLDRLTDLCRDYDNATVSDLYDLVGITGSFTDNKWGWFTMNGATVRQVRGGGYLLVLPAPESID